MATPPVAVQQSPRRHRLGLAGAFAWARHSPLAFDAALAVLLTLVTLAGSVGESHPNQQDNKPPAGHHLIAAPPAAYLLVAASGLVLVWRRRRPVLVLGLSLGAALLYTCLGYFDGA